MLVAGDRVTHNQFPPVTGVVMGVQDFLVGNMRKVAVLNDATGTLYYDFEDTWDVVSEAATSFEYRYDGRPCAEPEQEIIDVEFEVVDDD